MKTLSFLFVLALIGCSSIPKEQMLNDVENQAKLAEIKSKVSVDLKRISANDEMYTECVKHVRMFNDMVNKSNINENDFNKVVDRFGDKQHSWNKNLKINEIRCSLKFGPRYDLIISYRNEFNKYCEQKYGFFDVDNCKKMFPFDDLMQSTDMVFSNIEQLETRTKQFCKSRVEPIKKMECKGDPKKGCLVDISGYAVLNFGTRENGVLIEQGNLFMPNIPDYFVYDDRQFFDGQRFKDDGYYYEYVGIYDNAGQRIRALKRSNHKVRIVENADYCGEFQ